MLLIPLQPVPAQTLSVTLAGQPVKLHVYQKSTGLFMDVYLNDAPIIIAVICQHGVLCIRDAYLGFIGDLCFFDTQGSMEPYYTGLDNRYVLAYLQS